MEPSWLAGAVPGGAGLHGSREGAPHPSLKGSQWLLFPSARLVRFPGVDVRKARPQGGIKRPNSCQLYRYYPNTEGDSACILAAYIESVG